MKRNKVYGCLTRLIFTKSAETQVFLPFDRDFHAAEIFLQTISIKHCEHSSVFGGQFFSPCWSKHIIFPEKFLSKSSCSLRSSFSRKLFQFFGNVSLYLFWIDCWCNYRSHRLPPEKQIEKQMMIYQSLQKGKKIGEHCRQANSVFHVAYRQCMQPPISKRQSKWTWLNVESSTHFFYEKAVEFIDRNLLISKIVNNGAPLEQPNNVSKYAYFGLFSGRVLTLHRYLIPFIWWLWQKL